LLKRAIVGPQRQFARLAGISICIGLMILYLSPGHLFGGILVLLGMITSIVMMLLDLGIRRNG